MTRPPLRAVILACLVISLVMIPAVAANAEDLRWDSEIVYSADADEGLLHVRSEMTLTNLKPSTRSGNVITDYYYDRVFMYVPESALNLVATTSGRTLAYEFEEIEEEEAVDLMRVSIRLGRNLLYRQTMTLLVEYDIPGDPPRTESVFRVNPAYVSFHAGAWGDPERVTVKVVLPRGFTVDFDGEQHTWARDGELVVYEFADIADPEEFFIWVKAWNDSGMEDVTAGLDEFDIAVKAWPDDPDWGTEVLEAVESGLPVLQELVGLEWEPKRTLDILESQTVTIAGYGGWYTDLYQEILIGEWVDPHLVLHELSHTWFNDDLFEERWITEGLANEFAAEATERAGMESEDYPRPTEAPSPYRTGILLNEWTVPDVDDPIESRDYEEYGYGTSFWVLAEIGAEIGHDALRRILRAAQDDLYAYQQVGLEDLSEHEVDDWRRFLDLLQEIGGSDTAPDLFEEFVTDEDLNLRAEARIAYSSLRDTGWAIPLYVRQPMEEWEFDLAQERIDEALKVLSTRDTIVANAGNLGVEAPGSLQVAFESASDSMTETAGLAVAQHEASENVITAMDAVTADRGFLTTLGLIGQDPDLELTEAIEAFVADDLDGANIEAAEVLAIFEEAPGEGQTRLLLAVGGLLVLSGSGTWIVVRRRRRGPGAESEPVEPILEVVG